MSCEICGRGACQRSFHSFEQQERYDRAKEFDGNIRAIADALDSRDSEISELKAENTHLRERIVLLQAEVDVLNGTACAEEQARGKGPCGSCRTCRNERIVKLEACVKAADALREKMRKVYQRPAYMGVFDVYRVHGFTYPKDDADNWIREQDGYDLARAALGEVEREG